MNLDNNPTMDQLRDLLRACDDRAGHHVLWVDRAGEVHITKVEKKWPVPQPGPEVLDNALVRFETFWAGKGYVGAEAATSDEWITDAFNWLLRDWASAKNRGEPVLIGI
ncbi:MAG: hypothetical protein L0241_11620 [Planctomycetia bacterium]|nr:hypothetical protein [Planctomycetia bacterium]